MRTPVTDDGVPALRQTLEAIEADLGRNRYRRGQWDAFVRRVRRRPRRERLQLAADITRVSRKLHGRRARRTLSVLAGLVLEVVATVVGGAALAIARTGRSDAAALLAAAIWITTFQPLVKLLVGTALGVRYEYAYLHGIEPRFKMRYGTYLAAPRWARIAVHASGTVGSPLAAWLLSRATRAELPLAGSVCAGVFWVTLALNALLFLAAAMGRRRIGPTPLSTTSGGCAALELRDALGWDA